MYKVYLKSHGPGAGNFNHNASHHETFLSEMKLKLVTSRVDSVKLGIEAIKETLYTAVNIQLLRLFVLMLYSIFNRFLL